MTFLIRLPGAKLDSAGNAYKTFKAIENLKKLKTKNECFFNARSEQCQYEDIHVDPGFDVTKTPFSKGVYHLCRKSGETPQTCEKYQQFLNNQINGLKSGILCLLEDELEGYLLKTNVVEI